MAQAFNEKVDRLLVKAKIMIEEGWELSQDVFVSPQAKKPGRPTKKSSTSDLFTGRNPPCSSMRQSHAAF